MKFFNFYPHISLETVFPALKLAQICCINMNISFLENWQFLNHKLAPPLLLIYQAWNSNLTIWQNMKVSRTQKFQLFNSIVNLQPKLTFNNWYFIYFMNWKKLGSPTAATLTNANFQCSLFKLGKNWSKPNTHIEKSPFWI